MSSSRWNDDDDLSADEQDTQDAQQQKKGKSKSQKDPSKNQELRKVQNRIAQREFRHRKQQYIRDLEAKVELLSSNKEDQVDQLRAGINAVLEENKQLRQLLTGLSTFIGQGIGGKIHELGLSQDQLNEIISRPDDQFLRAAVNEVRVAKGMKSIEIPTPSTSHPIPMPDTNPRPTKRKKFVTNPREDSLSPPESSSQTATKSKSPPPAQQQQKQQQPQVPQPPPIDVYAAPPFPPPSSAHHNGYPPSVGVGVSNVPRPGTPPNMARPPSTSTWNNSQPKFAEIQPLYRVCNDSPKIQAMQMISYHLQNKRNNPDYVLPPAFTPTTLQLTVPHDAFIDGIIWRDLRDRLILCQQEGRSMTEIFNSVIENIDVHSEDILDPASWELHEPFLRKYYFIIDDGLLHICNRWRIERGETPLDMLALVHASDQDMFSLSGQAPAHQILLRTTPNGDPISINHAHQHGHILR